MKQLLSLAFAGSMLLFSCGNAETKEETANAAETATAAETPATSEPIAMTGKKDPVCGMDKDGTWTDYTVANGDTTWFCSETCKTAYMAKPEKYSAK